MGSRNIENSIGGDGGVVASRRRRRERRHMDETDQLVIEVIRILSSIFTLKNITLAFIFSVLILISCVGVIWPNPCENGIVSSSILQNFGTIFSSREWNEDVLQEAKQEDIRCMCDWMWLNNNVTVQDCYDNTDERSNNRHIPPSCFIKGFGIGPTEIYRNTVIIACSLRTSVRIGISNGSIVGGLYMIPSAMLQATGRFILLIVELIVSIVNNTLVPVVRWLMEEVALRLKQKRSQDMQDSINNGDNNAYDSIKIGSETIITDLSSFVTGTNILVEDGNFYDWHIVPKSYSLLREGNNDNRMRISAPSIDDEVNVDMLIITTVAPDAHRRFSLIGIDDIRPKFNLSIRFKSSPYACIDTSHFTNQQGSLFKRISEISIGNDRLAKQRIREIFEFTSKDDYMMMVTEDDSSPQSTRSIFGRRGVRSTMLECSSLPGGQVPLYEGSVLIRINEVNADDSLVTIVANLETMYHISTNTTLDEDEKSRLLQGIVKETFWSNEPMKPWRDAFNTWFRKSATLESASAQESVSNLWNIELTVTEGVNIVSNDKLSTLGGPSLESSVAANAFSNLISQQGGDDGVNSLLNFKVHSISGNIQRNHALMSFARSIGTNYCSNNSKDDSKDSKPCTSLVVMRDIHFWIVQSRNQPSELSITQSLHHHRSHYSDILQAVRDEISKEESDSFLFSDNTFSCWFSYFSSSIARHYGISKQLMIDHYSSSDTFNKDDMQTMLTLHNHWIEFEKYFAVNTANSSEKVVNFSSSDLVLEVGSVLQSYRANPSMSHLCPHIIPGESLLLNLHHREGDGGYGAHRHGLTNIIMDEDGRSRVFNVMMKLLKDERHKMGSGIGGGGGGGGGITSDNLFAVESHLVEMCNPESPMGEKKMKMNFIQCLDGAFSLAYYRHWMSPELSLLTTISNNANGFESVESFQISYHGQLVKDDDNNKVNSLAKLTSTVMNNHACDTHTQKMNMKQSSFVIVDENNQIVVDDEEDDHSSSVCKVKEGRLFFRNRAALAVECIPTSSKIQRYTLNPRHLSMRIYNNSVCNPIKP